MSQHTPTRHNRAERHAYAAWRKVQRAITALRLARDLLKAADAPRTVARVRLAITSAGGAERHSYNKYVRAWSPTRDSHYGTHARSTDGREFK